MKSDKLAKAVAATDEAWLMLRAAIEISKDEAALEEILEKVRDAREEIREFFKPARLLEDGWLYCPGCGKLVEELVSCQGCKKPIMCKWCCDYCERCDQERTVPTAAERNR